MTTPSRKMGWFLRRRWHKGKMIDTGPWRLNKYYAVLYGGPYGPDVGNEWFVPVSWWKYRVAWKYYYQEAGLRLWTRWKKLNKDADQPLIKWALGIGSALLVGYMINKWRHS